VYAGPTAATTILALRDVAPVETIVLFGASHLEDSGFPALDDSEAWETPIGPVEVDRDWVSRLVEAVSTLRLDRRAHAEEHSIEVIVPLLRALIPSARIVPIVLPPLADGSALGADIARLSRLDGRRVVALGSTDLTHYGPSYGFHPAGLGESAHAWAKEVNDRRLLDHVVECRAEAAHAESLRSRSACGPAALAATVAFAREIGAGEGRVLHHTTSREAKLTEVPTDDFVGYASVVFCGPSPVAREAPPRGGTTPSPV
jgi:hypothetical protein